MSPIRARRVAWIPGLILAVSSWTLLQAVQGDDRAAPQETPGASQRSDELISFREPPKELTHPASDSAKNAEGEPSSETTLAIAIAPQGGLLARSGDPATIELRALPSGRRLSQFSAHTEPVTTLAFDPTGKRLATGGFDRLIKLWDVPEGTERLTFAGHTGWIRAVAFSPDGKTLASAGQEGDVRLWDASTGRELAVLRAHSGPVRALAWSPGGESLVSAGADRLLTLWNLAARTVVSRWPGHEGTVRALAWSPDGATVASAGEDHLVIVRKVTDGGIVHRVAATADQILSLAFTPKGRAVLAGGYDGSIRVIESSTGRVVETLTAHGEGVVALGVERTSGQLVSAGYDRRIYLWETTVPIARLVTTIDSPKNIAGPAIFSPDGKSVVVHDVGSRSNQGAVGSLRFHDATTGKLLRELEDVPNVGLVEFSQNGKALLIRTQNGRFSLRDASTLKERKSFDTESSLRGARIAGIDPDGNRVAFGLSDSSIVIWDAASGTRKQTLPRYYKDAQAVSTQLVRFSPTGGKLLSSHFVQSADGTGGYHFLVWDLATNEPKELAVERVFPNLLWSPDGRDLVGLAGSGGPAAGLRILRINATSGQVTSSFPAERSISQVGFALTPDGKRVTTSTTKGGLTLWDLDSRSAIGTIRVAEAGVVSASFDPTGRRIVTTTGGNLIKIWELAESEPTRESQRRK
ncbi:MAG: hypothetical protein U0794_20235 [Isosphaeraceae bacterium]